MTPTSTSTPNAITTTPSDLWTRFGLVVLAGFALGSSAVMIRMGIGEMPPLMLIVMRFCVTTLAFGLVIAATRRSFPRGGRLWLDIVLSGLLATALPVVLFTLALRDLSSGVFGILLALYPMLTALLAHWLLEHERLTVYSLIGLGLAFGGTLMLILTGTSGLETSFKLQSYLLTFAGVVSSAFGTLYVRARLRDQDAIIVTAGQVLISLPVILPLAWMMGFIQLADIPIKGWIAVVYSGLIGSFLGYWLLFLLTRRYGATAGALPGYVMPVASLLLGAHLLGELITLPLLGGAALVLAGVIIASGAAGVRN